jgi:hypothetical protein
MLLRNAVPHQLLSPTTSLLRAQPARLMTDLPSLISSANVPLTIALAFATGVRISEQRPRGMLAPSVQLRVGLSNVPGAGRGVFAAAPMAAGTVLGTYPGRLRSPLGYAQKLVQAPAAAEYCWNLGDAGALDPTDRFGKLMDPLPLLEDLPGLSILSVPTLLALINEPPPGNVVNVATCEEGSEVTFACARDLVSGEELFLDCARPPTPKLHDGPDPVPVSCKYAPTRHSCLGRRRWADI